MKKNNTYLVDDEIDLADLIKPLWREKILILSISIICGLVGYLYAFFQLQEFKAEIILKNPPPQLFEPYSRVLYSQQNINNNHNHNNHNHNNNLAAQFIYNFKLNLLSLDNLQSFVEESNEFDNFKVYLKSRNISTKKYFANKIDEVKKNNLIMPNIFFLVFTKELEGDIFLKNYVQFIKQKTVLETKKILKLSIENQIIVHENALENAILINLENPILRSMNQKNQVVNEPEDLFYKGSKVLSQEILYLKRLLIKLENDQFNYELISDKSLISLVRAMPALVYCAAGLILGLFLSLGIIFFKGHYKE